MSGNSEFFKNIKEFWFHIYNGGLWQAMFWSLNEYYKTNVAFLMSKTKNLQAALFWVIKHLFLACFVGWGKQPCQDGCHVLLGLATALPRWLPCFVGWGKQPCQDGCHVLLGEANSPAKMFYNRNNHHTLMFC